MSTPESLPETSAEIYPPDKRQTLRCLLLSDEALTGYEDRYHWSHPDIPSFLSYDAVIIKSPPSLDIWSALSADLRQAELASIPVVWLINASSPVEVLKEITGGEVLPIRHGIDYEHVKVTSPAYGDLFPDAFTPRFGFALPRQWSTIAYVADPAIAIAATHDAAGTAPRFFLPAEAYRSLRSVHHLIGKLRQIIHSRTTPQQHHAAVVRATIIIFLFTLVALGLWRHAEKQQAFELKDSDTITGMPIPKELRSLKPEDLRALRTENPQVLAGRRKWKDVLKRYHQFALFTKESIAVDALLSTGRGKEVSYYANQVWITSIREAFVAGHYESARYLSQRYLNLINSLPPSEEIAIANQDVDSCRKVVRLIQRNFLPGQSVALPIFARILPGRAEPTLISSTSANVHPSLEDDVAYHNAALSARDLAPAERQPYWLAFLGRYPTSDLADDASFNVISDLMNSIRTADPNDARRIELEAIRLLDVFISTHRTSALADDALFYKMRLHAHVGNPAAAWQTFRTLAARPAPLNDAMKLARYVLQTRIIPPTRAADRPWIDEFLIEAAASPDVTVAGIASRSKESASMLAALREATQIPEKGLGIAKSGDVAQRMVYSALKEYKPWIPLTVATLAAHPSRAGAFSDEESQ
jgi:hypothetical protein